MKRKTCIVIALVFVALFTYSLAPKAGAQIAVAWTKAGNLPNGVWDLAPEDATSKVYYALGEDGMSRTTDGGATWSICSREAHAMRVVSPLAGQNTTTALFAATSSGLRRSDDGCRTWNDVPTQEILPSGGHIRWITPYPNNLTVLYAGTDGLGGLYRSIDGGSTWQAASAGLPPGGWVTSLTADPGHPEVVLVSLRYTGRNHPSSYVYRSVDGGLTWRSSSVGLYVMPNTGSYVNGLSWSGDSLFASTRGDGLYSSTDRGASWHAATMPRRAGELAGKNALPVRIDSLAASADGELVIGTAEGAFHSLDGGRSWLSFGPEGTLERDALLALDAKTGRALLGTREGIWSYRLTGGAVTLPTATESAVTSLTPTRPPPPRLPTSTRVPLTSSPTKTPAPPAPKPTAVQGYKPSDPAEPGDPGVFTYFLDTKHNLGHGFRDFWQTNGGLAQFGFPTTEEYADNGVIVQYFQRARFDYRDGSVTLARLGAELTGGTFFRPIPFFPSTDNNVYFGATGHSVEGPFVTFWRDNGRETLLGYPLSESFKDDGSEYQWFERARIEWHPFLPQGQQIVLGNIGTLALKRKGWLP